MEHGRRFHAFRSGGTKTATSLHEATQLTARDTAYMMPNDENEMDRLDLNHHMIVLAMDKKLFIAPIDEKKTQRVLDLGTGTGICELF